MSLNENGITVDTITVYDLHTRMTEGQVVGIVLGWLFGAIGLYLLGLFLIWKCCKGKSEEQDSRVSNSMQEKDGPNTKSAIQPGRHRKQMFEENPTLQMVNVTDSHQLDSHQINLNFGNKQYYNQQENQDNEENQHQMKREETQEKSD